MMMALGNPRADAPRTVLISTDRRPESVWSDQLADLLEPRGVGIEWARTGSETISVVEAGRADLAVLSTELPRMDGLAVLRIIRSLDAQLPCVLVARQAPKRLLEQALGLDAYSVLTTPINTRVMETVMARIFRKFFETDLFG